MITAHMGGKDRPMKFGTNQTAEYCRVRGITLAEAQTELSGIVAVTDKDGNVIQESTATGSEVRDLIYSALWAAAMSKGEAVDFNEFTVGDWIDEMEQDALGAIFQSLIDANDGGSDGGAAEVGKP